MAVYTGTSGYSYPAWKGHFYPKGTRADQMLDYYVEHLDSTELNSTFYRLPSPGQLGAVGAKARPGFCFAVKAPQTITHRKRLKEVEEPVAAFIERALELGDALGPVLFQLPPNMKADLGRLKDFLASFSERARLHTSLRLAVEFRHESWLTEGTFQLLSEHGAALVVGDSDEGNVTAPLLATAPFLYVRLRRTEPYSDADLALWAEKLASFSVSDLLIYFKHEVQGPAQARTLADRLKGG